MRKILSSISLCGLVFLSACSAPPLVSAPPNREQEEKSFRLYNKQELVFLTRVFVRGLEDNTPPFGTRRDLNKMCSDIERDYASVEQQNESLFIRNQEHPRYQTPYQHYRFYVANIALCDANEQLKERDIKQ